MRLHICIERATWLFYESTSTLEDAHTVHKASYRQGTKHFFNSHTTLENIVIKIKRKFKVILL